MLTTTKKLKWLLALVLIFGGFTVYKLFEGLAHNPAYHEQEWLFKIISEFGLFVSVVVSVGYFHHWFIAAEEHKESEIHLRETLAKYSKLFKVTLEDVISRIDNKVTGSLGVFVYDGLPCIPLFIIVRNKSRKVEVYNSYYLTEPVSKMPYLHWETDLSFSDQTSFESECWNMAELFLDYFKRRWEMEKERLYDTASNELVEDSDFIYAPVSAKKKCSELFV